MRPAFLPLVLMAFVPSPAGSDAPVPAVPPDLIVTEVPRGSSPDLPEPCAPGSRVVRIGPGEERSVPSGALTACDPALDAAGERLVFRGREAGAARWRIWRLDLEGDPEPRPLPSGELDCRRPTFLTDGVAAVCGGDLYRLTAGSEALTPPVRLTSSGGGIEAARVAPDGRLLLATRDDAGAPLLLTAQPDGTWATRWRDRPVPGLQAFRPLTLEEAPAGGVEGAVQGLLLAVEPTRGSGKGRGGLWLGSLADPFAPLRRVFPDEPAQPAGASPEEGISLRDPSPLPDGDLLVALRPSPGARYGVHRLGLGPGGSGPVEVARSDGHLLQPLAVAPRPPDTAIPGIVKPELNTGYLVLFDAARSDHPELAGIERGEIAAVRIFPWADGPGGGTAVDLEPAGDGSLHLEVPSDRPYGMTLVGSDGELVGPAGGPFWVRPNERRACMGCHVSVRYAPPNVRPEALGQPPRWVGWGAERRGPRSELEEGSH